MATVIDSLLVRLGFDVDPKGMEGFAQKIQSLRTGMMAMGAAAVGGIYGIERLVRGTSERMGGIAEFSEQMGLSSRSVAALGKVARENGGSLEGMEQGLRQMTIMAGQAAQRFGLGARMFKRFGMEVKDTHGQVKPVEQLLGDVADKLQKLPSLGQKLALGSRLGFDAATVKLMSKGRAEFDRLREAALKDIPFADRDYAAALQTERGFKKAEAAVTQLKDRIAVGLMPTVNAFLSNTIAWAKNENNIRKLKNIFNELASILTFVAKHAKAAALGFTAITLAMKGTNNLIRGSLLGALLLVAEDLWSFSRGGKSVTGWMKNHFPEAVGTMEDALAVLGAALVAFQLKSGPAGLMVLGVYEMIQAGRELQRNWTAISDWWDDVMDGMFNSVADMVNPIISLLNVFGAGIAKMDKDVFLHARNSRVLIASVMGKQVPGETQKNFFKEETTPSWLKPSAKTMQRWRDGGGAAGDVTNTTTVGEINLHVHGGAKMTDEDWKRGAKKIKHHLVREAQAAGKDAARVSKKNADLGSW